MNRVAAGLTESAYNRTPPYHPDRVFPECRFREQSAEPNPAYALLRDLFFALGYDAVRHGSADWNPLGHLIRPGDTVVLKPNFVLDCNQSGDDLFASITHPSVIRAVIDYVYIALAGRGRMIVADAPQMDCSWDKLAAAVRLDTIQDFYRERFGFAIEVCDLRNFELIDARQPAFSSNRRTRPGDPAGSVVVNLGRKSAFYGLPSENYYGADYDRRETIARHHGETHEYSVSRTVLDADVFISLPKMKVHKKVGVTLNLKGLVGINTNKNCLVHYRLGSPSQGGDQLPDSSAAYDATLIRGQRKLFDVLLARQNRFADATYKILRAAYRTFIKPFRPISNDARSLDAGNWHGNDSAWRMTADLAAVIHFAGSDGSIGITPRRRLLSVVDGIIGGDREGPLAPTARPAGVLVAGENLLAVDLVTARLMGFDPRLIKTFSIMRSNDWNFGMPDFQSLEIIFAGSRLDPATFFSAGWLCPVPPFTPHPGWIGQLEIKSETAP